MSRMRAALLEVANAVTRSELRGPALAFGRTLLALAELSVLVLTPNSALFTYETALPSGMSCEGLRSASLWCVAGTSANGMLLARMISITVLVLVLAGYRSRWTCIPHFYVAFSLSSSMTLANGGDHFAQVGTLLLIPICIQDKRKWHWARPTLALSPFGSGSASAVLMITRVQVLVIYVGAACAKLADPAWRNGTALQIVAHDPNFGFPAVLRDHLSSVLGSYWPMALVAWTVIGMEIGIGVAMNLTWRWRRRAMAAGTVLHLSIAILLGLPSFGLTMIGLLVIAYGSRPRAVRTLGDANHREGYPVRSTRWARLLNAYP